MTTENTTSIEQLLTLLRETASGLLYPSETDAPLTPYWWDNAAGSEPSPEALLRTEDRTPDTAVEETGAADFFAPVTEGDGEDAARFRKLEEILKRDLTDLRGYRVGAVDIDVYLLGRHASGEWIGLKTHVVET